MSDRIVISEPDAAWATVCFRAAWQGAPGDDDPGGRSSFVVWRSRAGHGPGLVRLAPLASSVGRHTDTCPLPCPHEPASPSCDVHLWVDADSPERAGLMEYADVLVSHVPLPPESAHRRVRELLSGRPGCLAAAVRDTATTIVVGVRGRTGGVSFVRPGRCGSAAPPPLHAVASVVHAWVVSGRSPHALVSVSSTPRR